MAAGAFCWPYQLRVPIVLNSGSLNLLEPSDPLQACNGIALPSNIYSKMLAITNCLRLNQHTVCTYHVTLCYATRFGARRSHLQGVSYLIVRYSAQQLALNICLDVSVRVDSSYWCTIFQDFRLLHHFFKISDWCINFQYFGLMHYFSCFRPDALFFKISDCCNIFSRFRTDALIFNISDRCTIFHDFGLMHYFSRFRTDALFFMISAWWIIFQDFGLLHHFFKISDGCIIFQDFD